DAQRQAGDAAHRETLLAAAGEARALGDTELLVAAALANSRGWASLTGTVDEERIAVLEVALDAVGPDDTGHRTRLLATLVAELTFDNDLDRRRAVAEEAIAIARRLDDPRAIVAALIGLLSLPDRADTDHLRWADEAIDLASQLDDSVSLAIATASAVTSAVSFADRERFDRYLRICTDAVARVGQPALAWRATGVRALEAILNGDLEAAENLAAEILPTAVEMGYALIWYGSVIITIRGHQGRGGEVRQMVASVAGDPNGGSASELARAGLLLTDTQSRDYDSARSGFDEQARNGFSARDDQLWLTHVCMNAHVCARLGDRERAAVLLAMLEPSAGLIAATASICLFSAAACAGMLAALLDRHTDADRHFANAVALTTGFRAPYLIATAELEWARALLRRTPASEARAGPMLASALTAARQHGYAEIERDALELISLLTTA
ncbi:MAG TPA: hypothetical protein VL769_11175, partial [Acidimicrobiia bacterium]|nr:hypothetical protein [Acidimicrobiia bacterium]